MGSQSSTIMVLPGPAKILTPRVSPLSSFLKTNETGEGCLLKSSLNYNGLPFFEEGGCRQGDEDFL
jgi:hypothetical protein